VTLVNGSHFPLLRDRQIRAEQALSAERKKQRPLKSNIRCLRKTDGINVMAICRIDHEKTD